MARRAASLSRQPDNLSILKPNGFMFVIDRIPTVRYFTTRLQLPGITTNPPPHYTNTEYDSWDTGDKIEFDDFQLSFQLDEDMINFEEITKWITWNINHAGSDKWFSDATLLVLGNKEQVVRRIRFERGFPYMVLQVPFDTADSPDAPIFVDTTFKFSRWYFSPRET